MRLRSEKIVIVAFHLSDRRSPNAEIGPLRRRINEDMTIRNLSQAEQRPYVSASANRRCFGRSFGLNAQAAGRTFTLGARSASTKLNPRSIMSTIAWTVRRDPRAASSTGRRRHSNRNRFVRLAFQHSTHFGANCSAQVLLISKISPPAQLFCLNER
ncbi:hypothetical protein AJ88_28700 [Mesorhizobium amorphae CCBAU 01583]|nr:hypothetical protein AJ88_28700 [Mesorhizobium amorphae CCBAU 01583]